jgi:pimeloyl-ACP methyl ester carboxylesterase
MADAACDAATDPLKESGAMTMIGGGARMRVDVIEPIRTDGSETLRHHGISPANAEKTMRRVWRASALILTAIALGSIAHRGFCAADSAREARLAQEILPSVVVGDAVYLVTARQPSVLAIYTDGTSPAIAKAAVIVTHGLGVHPDWGLINGLRTGLAEAGVATLSVQMPVLGADAPREQYATLFPESNERLAAAIAFLRKRGMERIAIVSHSMGSSMADAYLSSSSAAKLAAWVPIGMMNAFGSRPVMPVLDVVGEHDFRQVLELAPKRAAALPHDGCSKQIVIAGTDHYMENRQKELVAAIAPFLQRTFTRQC